MNTRKIGKNKGQPRLWLEGIILSDNGFNHTDRYNIEIQWEKLIISLNPEGKRKISGKLERPVIDIQGKALLESGLSAYEKVAVRRTNSGLEITKEG